MNSVDDTITSQRRIIRQNYALIVLLMIAIVLQAAALAILQADSEKIAVAIDTILRGNSQ